MGPSHLQSITPACRCSVSQELLLVTKELLGGPGTDMSEPLTCLDAAQKAKAVGAQGPGGAEIGTGLAAWKARAHTMGSSSALGLISSTSSCSYSDV